MATRTVTVLRDVWTATLTGCTTAPTFTIHYTIVDNEVSMRFPEITGTSNATGKTLTGMPAALRPADKITFMFQCLDNTSSFSVGMLIVNTSGVIDLFTGPAATAFTNAGTMALGNGMSMTYQLL